VARLPGVHQHCDPCARRRARGGTRISLKEFDALITLFNAAEGRPRMTELADRVILTPSCVTHLVTRLARAGLVARILDEQDRRSSFATLTEAGGLRLRVAPEAQRGRAGAAHPATDRGAAGDAGLVLGDHPRPGSRAGSRGRSPRVAFKAVQVITEGAPPANQPRSEPVWRHPPRSTNARPGCWDGDLRRWRGGGPWSSSTRTTTNVRSGSGWRRGPAQPSTGPATPSRSRRRVDMGRGREGLRRDGRPGWMSGSFGWFLVS
jgi:DNA-binding MarR family transcriptional regulator